MLTQVPRTTVIEVPSQTLQFGPDSRRYLGGFVDAKATGTWHVYADDPQFKGGEVTFKTTRDEQDVFAKNGRIYFGRITLAD